jgi:chromosome segregation ATPase
MRIVKRLAGIGLVVLGLVGIAVCLAGVAGVWVVGSRLQQVNSQVFGQADQWIVQLDRRVAQARAAAGETQKLIDQFQQALRDSAKDLIAQRLTAIPEIDNLERRLAAALERADGLVQVSAASAELIEQLLATADAAAADRHRERSVSSELMAGIRSTSESLAQASERLADVQRRLAEIRRTRDVDVNLTQITKLLLGVVSKLDAVQAQIAAFRLRLDETRQRLGHLQDRIRTWVVAGQCLVLLLIAWGGAGQYCLLVYGWQILRRPASGCG